MPEENRPRQELFDLANKTRDRALFGRKATALRDIGGEIRKKYDNAVWQKQPKNKNGELQKDAPMVTEGLVEEKMAIPNGGVQGWVTCDLNAAEKSVNKNLEEEGKAPANVKQDFTESWLSAEEGHRRNIDALKYAEQRISPCYA